MSTHHRMEESLSRITSEPVRVLPCGNRISIFVYTRKDIAIVKRTMKDTRVYTFISEEKGKDGGTYWILRYHVLATVAWM